MGKTSTTQLLDPKLLGFWVKCIRKDSSWSQEAVAASANLTVRTIQRVEAGEPSDITTRRALARGLGYDNVNIFDDPAFAITVTRFLQDLKGTSEEAMEKQFPDHQKLPVARVKSGTDLGRLGQISQGMLPNIHDDVAIEARERIAELLDYLQDVQDVADVSSYSQKLGYENEMGIILAAIEELGVLAYSGTHAMQSGVGEKAFPITIGYITFMPADREVTEIMVPRRVSGI
jgi:transcriptional regulator with XRE-family HTH domain